MDIRFPGDFNSEEQLIFRDFFFPDGWQKVAKEEANDIMDELIDFPRQKVLLDIPCGIGRHSVPLAKKGMRVTGVDLCISYLDEIEERAKSEGFHYEVIQDNIKNFKRPNFYDVVILLWDSLGVCGGKDEDIEILKLVYDNLKKGGQFILERQPSEFWALQIDKNNIGYAKYVYEDFEKKNINIEELNLALVDDFKNLWIYCKTSRLDECHNRKVNLINYKMRVRGISELDHIMKGIGFKDIQHYSDFKRSPYGYDDMLAGKTLKTVTYK